MNLKSEVGAVAALFAGAFVSLCLAAERQVTAEAADSKAEAVAPGRSVQSLDRGWKFRWGKSAGVEKDSFDASAWKTVDLPHDAQFEQPWTKGSGARGFKPMGECWYRNSFKTDGAWAGRRVFLDFGGILCVGDVFVNGRKVHATDYGYLGFEVDVTKALRPVGEDNVVAVWAGTGKTGGSRWYTGAGLYRTARIVVKPEVSVARHGLFVRTPEVSDEQATVAVTVELDGFRGKGNQSKLVVKTTLADAEGKTVAANEVRAPWSKLRHQEVAVPALEIAKPRRWDVDSPYLYTATVALELDGVEIDRVSTRFGVRTLEFDAAFGFRLNGKKVFLKGMSNHHDMGPVGAAAFPSAIRRQFETMKRFGYNAIRCSHNPYSEEFYALADEIGLLVVDELIDKWSDKDYWFGRRPFTSLWPSLITEWVKRDRNHASVVAWSLGNEFQMSEHLCGYDGFGDWGVTMYRIMRPAVLRWDPTRALTVAMFPARAGAVGRRDPGFNDNPRAPELSLVTDFGSFNYQWPAYASYVKNAPGLNVFQSEATVRELLAPYLGMDRAHSVGCSYWGAIEYWGESNGWPKKGWNYSFFSHTLEAYPSAYLIKSAMTDEPVVRIAVEAGKAQSEMWNDVQVGVRNEVSAWEGTPGKAAAVRVYTNAESVELFLNGKSLGEKRNDGVEFKDVNTVAFEVPFAPGTLLAVAKRGGREVARHEVRTAAGPAVRLEVEVERADAIRANGTDLVYVRCRAVDANGTTVPSAKNRVAFAAEGAASFYACDNGDHYTDELFTPEVNAKGLKNGFILAVFRAGTAPGDAKLTFAAEGLPTVEKTVFVR